MARKERYSFADWSPAPDEADPVYEAFGLLAERPKLVRTLPMNMSMFPRDPADPTSWRRDGDFMVPVEGFVRHLYVVLDRGPAGGYVGAAALQETMVVNVALDFTPSSINVTELGIRSLGTPLTRTNMDAVPTTAMVGRLAALQCLVDRLDRDYVAMGALSAGGVELFPAGRPRRGIVITPTGRPPAPTMVDADGTPWWRVTEPKDPPTTTPPPGRRRRMTPEALAECWAVYSAAKAEGSPTTPAVEEWLDYPSLKTVERWISAAKKHQETA